LKYAIDYAQKKPTIIISWDDGVKPKKRTLKTKTDKDKREKQAFIQGLSSKDTIYMELGGAGDAFSVAAFRKGAAIFRIPSIEVKKFREKKGISKEKTAEVIQILAKEKPELFYSVQKIDEVITRLRVYARHYLLIQRKLRIAAQLRLDALFRDQWLIEQTTGEIDEETYVKMKLAQSLTFKEADQLEKEMLKKIKEILPLIPAYEIFQNIAGAGPVIAAICIGEIGDIRRFPTEHALVAYAGYHVKDGKAVVRRKGRVANWNNNLRYAVWLFTTQTVERLPASSPWKAKLIARKNREKQLHPDFSKGYIAKRARRWLGTKFLRHIWREWQNLI